MIILLYSKMHLAVGFLERFFIHIKILFYVTYWLESEWLSIKLTIKFLGFGSYLLQFLRTELEIPLDLLATLMKTERMVTNPY